MSGMQQAMLGGGGGQSAEAAAILAALAHYWEFEENDAGSTFADAHGSQDMSLRGTAGAGPTSVSTGSATGLVGRYFHPNSTEGATAYIPTAAAFKFPNADMTFGAWIVANAGNVIGSSRFIMGNVGATATDFQVFLGLDSSNNQLWLNATTDGALSGRVVADSGARFDGALWTLVTATLDRTNNEIRVRMRRSDAGSITSVGTAFPSALYTGSTTANFCINDGLSSDSSYFSGDRAWVTKADQAFYMTKAISDAEFNWLFNAGSGRSYADLVAQGSP